MRVLLVPSWYPQDAQQLNGSFFWEQSQALAKHGIETAVICPNPVYADIWLRRPQLRKTHYLQGLNQTLGTAANPDEPGIPVWYRELRAWPQKFRGIEALGIRRYAGWAWKTCRKNFGVPDVIHAHTVFPGLLVARAIAQRAAREGLHIPVVATEHRPVIFEKPHQGRRGRAIVKALGESAYVSSVSRGFSDALTNLFSAQAREYGLPRPPQWQVTANLLGAAFENYPPAPATVSPTTPFLHLSNLGEMKNVPNLLRAYAESGLSRPLTIAGPAPRHAALQDLAKQLGVGEKVEFMGSLTRLQVRAEMGRFAGLLLPSRIETFGVVMIEALSQGVPVLATPTWGGREIVTPERGVLADGFEVADIAAALRALDRRVAGGEYDREGLRADAIAAWGEESFAHVWSQIYSSVSGG